MVIRYATRSPVIHFTITGVMGARRCKSLNLMVYQATAATIQSPRIDIIDLSFAALDDKIFNSTHTYEESLLWRPVKAENDFDPWQKDPQINRLNTKPASLQDWKSMVDFFLVEIMR